MIMRLDRCITLNIGKPLFWFKSKFIHFQPTIPVLMYHAIGKPVDEEIAVNPYFRVTTSSEQFEKQMSWLHDNGFQGVTLKSLLEDVGEGKKVVITFDDGFQDFYTNAWPILDRFGFSATVFLPTKFIGNSDGETLISGKPHLNWEQIQLLDKKGVEFGSHSHSHPVLYQCSKETVVKELRESYRLIENKIHGKVVSFSYPFAFPSNDKKYVQFICSEAENAGYAFVVSTQIGTNKIAGLSRKKIKRIPVNDADDIVFFGAKIVGAYNWVGVLQNIFKQIKLILKIKNKKKRF